MSKENRANGASVLRGGLVKTAACLLLCSYLAPAVTAAGPVNEAALRSAWALYTGQKYRESSDAFEALIAQSTPNARLYYYAALANRACNRAARAKQLCQYISTNFPSSQEAAMARKVYPDVAPPVASSEEATDPVPESLKGKSTEEMLKTPEGRQYVQEQLAKKAVAVATAKMGEASKVSPMRAKSRGGKPGERVFTAEDIAREGPNGIDQTTYPNCWFESTMSALASLPRGQRLMADMVSYGQKEGEYVVRFPGDGKIYNIDEKLLEEKRCHSKALWATLIECGQILKFPADNGNLLAEGLGCLTGQKAETLDPGDASDQELSSFIDGAVKSQNPIICASESMYNYPRDMPYLVIPSHAYTIIGFEPSSGMIKLRNPHGANSRRFELKGDSRHEKFEQMDDGVFKIHVSLFKKYYQQVAKAHI